MSTKKNLNPVSGPYRATKLWNDTVRTFYNEMPLSRHWRGLKQYDSCFTAVEAVDWLHGYLISNPNFGPTVTREQTLKLLRKFLKSGLIIEARGNKIYSEDLQDNRELFKFGNQSPLKVLRTPGRTPLAPIIVNALSNNGSSPVLKDDRKKNLGLHNDKKSESENIFNEKTENFSSVHKVDSSEEFVNKSWQETYFERLEILSERLMVGGDGSAPLVPMSSINASWIRHNITLLKSNRISSSEGFGSELPSWILSAMNCLVNWPNSSDSVCNIPNYPGVEIDIFKVVREFFSDMIVPLIPYDLYDPIIRLYIGAEFLDIAHRTPESGLNNDMDHSISSLSSYDSVEDLILNISAGGTRLQENLKNSNRALFPASKNENTETTYEMKVERRTPVSALITDGFSSIPNSLGLNKLNNYTNFKDSYLYSKEKQTPVNDVSGERVPSGVSNRLTLKYLKNKSSLGSRHSASNECVPSSASPFNEGLKTEELDSYCLPPNSCFETAFTSNSPRTRIIPQKSVDTIHFRHCIQSCRPKSIAVSSFFGMGKSCNELDKRSLINFDKSLSSSTYLDKKDSLDRSLSEGNLMKMGKENPPYSSNSHLSRTDGELDGRQCGHKKLNATSTLAAKVRDSIKRKKVKDSKHKHCKGNCSDSKSSNTSKEENSFEKYSSCGNFINSRTVNSFDLMNRMRTKSGGYENLALSTRSFSPDTISTKSLTSDISTFKNKSGGYINIGIEQSRNSLNHISEDHNQVTRSCQNYEQQSSLNAITANWKRTNPSNFACSARSTPQPFINRSKSATPDGCLSHSLASTLSNSIYHSALSAFSHTTYSNPSVHSRTPSVDRHCLMSPPELPKRKPALQMNSSEFDSFRTSLENENPNEHSRENLKSLSSSANELSDVWVDRTPFGTVPPFMRGGLWRHYHSSPSKRLMGRQHRLHKACGSSVCVPGGLLTKVGKEVCVEALQLLLLNLEPRRRRKLYLLLKMMNKVSANEKLQIDSLNTNRALMVKTFTRNVLLSSKERDYDEMLATRIVTLFMDNFVNIFSPPQNLAVLVHRKVNESIPRNECARYSHSRAHQPLTYCHQVSQETFEKQKFSGSQQFLSELLDQLVDNPKMSEKEKKKKLKEFKLHYPDIYNHKFLSGKENQEAVPEKKRKLKGLKKLVSIRSLGRHKSFRI